jgi:small subunit ribosomal protein S16
MIIIRLSRTGNKKRPFYHIVLANKTSPRDGRYVERLGFFNPIATGNAVELKLNLKRVEYWIMNGAQVSNKMHYLIKKYKNLNLSNELN